MLDDDNDQYGFWRDEPTRPLERFAARRKPAGPAPVAPTRRPRPVNPQVGRRQHGETQQIPVVANAAEGGRQGAGHVDPLLRRIGLLAVVVTLGVPVAMALRSGDDRSALQPQATTLAVVSAPAAATAAPVAPTQAVATDASAAQQRATEPDAPDTAQAEIAAAPLPEATVSNTIRSAPSLAAPKAVEVAVPVTAAELVCAKDYKVVAGDYWILIADKVSVSLSEVLAANNATVKTALYPGRTVCLPANASAPTTQAPATAAPTTTAKATTTTVKATTTSSPAATAPPNSYSRSEVEAIIRQVWPDELEDEAIRIATRESSLNPTVRNYCCFGLFQLYYKVHQTWLAQMGVTAAEQLYDPLTNAYAAYALYLRSGGWGPWKL